MDLPVSEPASNAIAELCIGEEIPANATLADLSNLNRNELRLFATEWEKLDDNRRVQVITRLNEMIEDNVEYNFDAIFRYCLNDINEEVRYLAIEGLWENEETWLIDPLIRILEEDESDKVQAAAATALGKFAVKAEFDKLRPEMSDKVTEALLAAIDDRNKSIEVVRRVLEASAPLSLPEIKDAITDAYESIDPGMKISAIFAMGKSCDLSWLPLLLKELDNNNPEIRYEAATACGELEDEKAVPGLIKLIEDTDVEVSMAAIQALGKIGGNEAKECLAACLENTDEAIVEAAKEALEIMSDSDDPLSFRM